MVADPAGALRDGGGTEPGLQTLWRFFAFVRAARPARDGAWLDRRARTIGVSRAGAATAAPARRRRYGCATAKAVTRRAITPPRSRPTVPSAGISARSTPPST